MKISTLFFTIFFLQVGLAAEFTSQNGTLETCLSASEKGELFGIKYSKKDKKNEKKLCSLDLHSNAYQYKKNGFKHQIAVCPKLVNTSPALEVFSIDNGVTKNDFLNIECKNKEKKGSKIAKYKVSTSCAYTPSILAYYHFSRLLNIGNVPVGVLRTVDREFHKDQATLGVQNTAHLSGWLPKNWEMLLSQINKGKVSIVHSDQDKTYGALVKNPKGEKLYGAMYGSGVKGYIKHDLYKKAKKRGPIEKQFPKSFRNLGQLFALKDYTDMLIIDAVLSQFDRYGNVDYWDYYYYKEDMQLKRDKVKRDDLEQKSKMQAKGAIVVKRMLLKDNDCGIAFRNRTLDDKALRKIRHFSKESFQKLEMLRSLFSSEEFKAFLKQELLFSENDINKVLNNTESVYALIKEGVESGKVLLDLNPNDFI